jgi:hypothetical protein
MPDYSQGPESVLYVVYVNRDCEARGLSHIVVGGGAQPVVACGADTRDLNWTRNPKPKTPVCRRCWKEWAKVTPGPIRWVATFVNKAGMRTLMQPAQGRNTHETEEAAREWLDAVLAGNSAERLRSIWGTNPRFEVRPVECWPGHFDPKGIYFDDHDAAVGL